jgi:hypothetical protein
MSPKAYHIQSYNMFNPASPFADQRSSELGLEVSTQRTSSERNGRLSTDAAPVSRFDISAIQYKIVFSTWITVADEVAGKRHGSHRTPICWNCAIARLCMTLKPETRIGSLHPWRVINFVVLTLTTGGPAYFN